MTKGEFQELPSKIEVAGVILIKFMMDRQTGDLYDAHKFTDLSYNDEIKWLELIYLHEQKIN